MQRSKDTGKAAGSRTRITHMKKCTHPDLKKKPKNSAGKRA